MATADKNSVADPWTVQLEAWQQGGRTDPRGLMVCNIYSMYLKKSNNILEHFYLCTVQSVPHQNLLTKVCGVT